MKEHIRRGTVQPYRARKAPKPRRRTAKTSGGAEQLPRDFVEIADGYVTDVLSGAMVACRWTRLACERFQRMRTLAGDTRISKAENGRRSSDLPPSDLGCHYTWSPAHVQDVCTFIERLPHVEGKWATETIRLEPCQVWWLAATYGFRRPDGGRLTTSCFFQVARKSAKSTLVAACLLYHVLKENEPGAQGVCGATTGNQARLVFSIVQRMVRRASWLREDGLTAYANSVFSSDTTIKPINAKSSTQDGLNPSFISLDESHAQDFSLHDVLKSAQGARRNPMLMAPTTAGHSLTSVGYALRDTAMKVLEGVTEADHLFAVLYELDEGDDWRDETTWVKAAPMLGVTPTLDFVRRYRDDAVATPGQQGEFEVKMCNKWLHSASRWLPMEAWHRCADATLRLEDFAHEPCWIGVDLAERDDIAAVALAFKRAGLVYVFVRGYLPAMVVSERARTVPEYRVWLERGELIATDGNLTDYPTIEADLRRDCETFDVQDIVIERYGALHLAANLTASGVPCRIEGKNAKTFTAPSKELESRVKAKQLRHPGTSFLTWHVSNACVERRRDGSLLPTKDMPTSANKIDGVDAICLALSGLVTASTVAPVEPRIFFLEA